MKEMQGKASYYNLTGSKMSNGKVFNPDAMNAAMMNVPIGTEVTVRTLINGGRSIKVTVTDRGPYVTGRIIDLTPKAFRDLFGSLAAGVGSVIVDVP